MDRRSVLKTVSIFVGGSLSVGTVSAIMSGCKPNNSSDWTPRLFSNDEIELLAEVVDVILPETDTPGAKELNVHRYIDEVLLDCHTEENQQKGKEGLKLIADKGFMKASAEERKAILEEFDKEAYGDNGGDHFFRGLKSLVIAGYFSTEIGQTKVLQHAPVPGKWVGCMPLAEAGEGRTWAQ